MFSTVVFAPWITQVPFPARRLAGRVDVGAAAHAAQREPAAGDRADVAA